MTEATKRQKQFLRQLGHKSVDGLTKTRASKLIDELLQAEKESGKTFPCPYCRKPFGPRPRRTKKCSACGGTIFHLSGTFYTEAKVSELNQKEWEKNTQKTKRETVKDDWREERSYRKEFGEAHTAGYIIKVGPACTSSQHLNGLLVLIEDANDTPELLPPFDGCRHDTCECDYVPVSPYEVPEGTKIAEWSDPEKKAKLKTRLTSPVSTQNKPSGSGCAGVLLAACAFVALIGFLMNAK